MITRFQLENFKGHRDTDLALQQFTLLVGDNGSGKTSVLEALRLPGELLAHAERGGHPALDELLRRGADGTKLSYQGQLHNQLWTSSIEITPLEDEAMLKVECGDLSTSTTTNLGSHREVLHRSVGLMGDVAFYRFRSDQVAAPAYSGELDVLVAEDGSQTAVVLADLKLADDERFNRIESALRRVVPSLERLRIGPAMVEHPSSPGVVRGNKLYFDFHGAKNVPAHHASQGTLVVLALLTVLHGLDRPNVVLLDDFDHTLHPRAQIELVRMIKELLALDEFKDTQIIATTHSPYVLDEVSPSNVIAFALREDGTVASKPLSEHPDALKVNGSLKAGELWTLDAERDWVR